MIIYDCREQGKVRHKLIDVMFIAVAATFCGCNEWSEMECWAIERHEWLKKYLELPNGIPSRQTIERVFDVIDPKQFEKCFAEWMKEVTGLKKKSVVAIDGKTVCGSSDESIGKKAIHIVNAWCSEDKLILGQIKTSEKSNEITAVPELLDMLFIKGCIVTVDTLNCQKGIAKKIVKEKKADYVLALKGNHPLLLEEVEEYFTYAEARGFNGEDMQYKKTIEKGHGRIEERLYYYLTDINKMESRKDWASMNGIGMVVRIRTSKNKRTEERSFYISSVKTIEDFAKGARGHWGVESAHWSLDVTFREDANKTRKGKAPENLAVLKRIAMNAVRKDQERHSKRSLKNRRFIAGLNTEYLEYIFSINFSLQDIN